VLSKLLSVLSTVSEQANRTVMPTVNPTASPTANPSTGRLVSSFALSLKPRVVTSGRPRGTTLEVSLKGVDYYPFHVINELKAEHRSQSSGIWPIGTS